MLNPTTLSLSLSIQNTSTILSPIQIIVGIHSCLELYAYYSENVDWNERQDVGWECWLWCSEILNENVG